MCRVASALVTLSKAFFYRPQQARPVRTGYNLLVLRFGRAKNDVNKAEACFDFPDQDIPHIVARNVTFHELEPDFNTDSVSYVIRWLPPLFSNQLSGFQLRYASIDGANINSFKVKKNNQLVQ